MARDYRMGGAPEINPLESLFKLNSDLQGQNKTNIAANEPYIKDQIAQQRSARNLQTALDTEQKLNQGRSIMTGRTGVKINGDGSVSLDETAPSPFGMYGKLGDEATKVDKISSSKLKPFQDQFNSANQTLNYLDMGTAQADKLALISEAQLAAGSGGSRAIKSIIDVISGGSTANMDYQNAVNWLNNTKSIPTMQPDQRNALREAVLGRMPQVMQGYNAVKGQLQSQIPQFAPMHQAMGQDKLLIDNTFGPTDDLMSEINKRNTDYVKQKAQIGNPQVGQPSVASPQQTNLQKFGNVIAHPIDALGSLLGKSSNPQPTTQQAPGGFDPDAYLKGTK